MRKWPGQRGGGRERRGQNQNQTERLRQEQSPWWLLDGTIYALFGEGTERVQGQVTSKWVIVRHPRHAPDHSGNVHLYLTSRVGVTWCLGAASPAGSLHAVDANDLKDGTLEVQTKRTIACDPGFFFSPFLARRHQMSKDITLLTPCRCSDKPSRFLASPSH